MRDGLRSNSGRASPNLSALRARAVCNLAHTSCMTKQDLCHAAAPPRSPASPVLRSGHGALRSGSSMPTPARTTTATSRAPRARPISGPMGSDTRCQRRAVLRAHRQRRPDADGQRAWRDLRPLPRAQPRIDRRVGGVAAQVRSRRDAPWAAFVAERLVRRLSQQHPPRRPLRARARSSDSGSPRPSMSRRASRTTGVTRRTAKPIVPVLSGRGIRSDRSERVLPRRLRDQRANGCSA